jgi:hypothetical protein
MKKKLKERKEQGSRQDVFVSICQYPPPPPGVLLSSRIYYLRFFSGIIDKKNIV